MVATAFLGFLNSPKWYKLNNNNKIYNNLNKPFFFRKKIGNKSVRQFSTFPLKPQLSNIEPAEPDNDSFGKCSKDVTDFLNNNKLRPVYIYENLHEKSTQNKILNDTKNIAGVYLILNKINLSCYVGSASRNKFNARFRKHLFNFAGSKIVKAAVKKYKIDNFAFMVLQVFPEIVSKENNKKLLDLEDYYLKSLLPDYNIVTEAGNTFGYKHSEITRIKMVNDYSTERRLRIGDLNKGKVMTDEQKANMKAAALTRKKATYSEESLDNMRKSSKAITVYNLDRTVYGEYPSVTAGVESLRCGVRTIQRAMSTPKKILRRR